MHFNASAVDTFLGLILKFSLDVILTVNLKMNVELTVKLRSKIAT